MTAGAELSLIAFTAAAALLTVTPGLDTALVLRTAAAEGAARAFRTGLGIVAGCIAWGLLVAFGLGALMAMSEIAYAALKLVGAAYLVWLGATLLLPQRRREVDRRADSVGNGHFRRGLLTNILNPKVGVFYVTFLPQFISVGQNVFAMTLIMAAIHAALGFAWFAILIAATQPLARMLRNRVFATWLDRVTGSLVVALGLRLALDRPQV